MSFWKFFKRKVRSNEEIAYQYAILALAYWKRAKRSGDKLEEPNGFRISCEGTDSYVEIK